MMLRSIAVALLLLGFVNAAASDERHPSLSGGETSPHNWSGFYAGIHGGYGRSSTNWAFPFEEYYNTAAGQGFSIDPKGGVVGGHLMLNRQFGRLVVGVEGAFSNATIREDRLGPVAALYPNDRFKTSIDDLATVSGRLGYAFDRWLVYAKGGYATAEIAHHALSGPPGAGVAASIESRRNGRTVGGGIEYMIAPRIVLGLEYQFAKFGAERHSTTATGSLTVEPVNIDAGDIALHAITARLSIWVGGGRSEAESLK